MISTFGLVKKLQRRREIQRISQEVEAHPSPRNIETLCERVLATKGPAAALDTVQQGLDTFPWSERLQVLAFGLAKAVAKSEIDEIQRALEQNPTPEAYGRLAERHRTLGDEDEAIRVCRECAARFPQNENAFLVEGRLRVGRYRRTGLPRDGMLAAEKLERAVVLNPDNLRARQLLGELYADVGALGRALPHLRFQTMHGVPDDHVANLLERAEENGGEPESSSEMTALLRDAARSERFGRNAPGNSATATPQPELETVVNELRQIEGVVAVEANSTHFEPRAGQSAGSTLSDLARTIIPLANESLVDMDMGNLRHAQVCGPWGQLLLFSLGSSAVIVQADSRVSGAEIRERVLSARAAASSTRSEATR